MTSGPVDLATLLAVVNDPASVRALVSYFEPERATSAPPRYAGSRFEFLAGGGGRPEAANAITADDLVAVTTLGVDVPGDVALQLLEGRLGTDVAAHLEQIPSDVGIHDPAAVGLLGAGSHARSAWDLLESPHGMGWVITNKLLARKRPLLIPVYDRVVRCAFGQPAGLWDWLLSVFADGQLEDHLRMTRRSAGVSSDVSTLRVLDVIAWMHHRTAHDNNGGCAGPGW